MLVETGVYPESSLAESRPRLLLVLGSAVTRYRYAEPCELGEAGESQALFDYMCLNPFGDGRTLMILVLKKKKQDLKLGRFLDSVSFLSFF